MMIRRRGKKAGGVEENIEPEKEEPVKEYKVSKLSMLLMVIRNIWKRSLGTIF